MKRYILLVILIYCIQQQATAQVKTSQPLKGALTSSVKNGDLVPDLLITNIEGLNIDGVPRRSARISDFKGKLLILDFWATWCAPCRAMVPVMDSLQKQFAGQVVFLPLTYESKAITEPVLAQMRKAHPFDLPEVTGEVNLHALFPHQSLPHYVWIDASGRLSAITEFSQVNAANIRKIVGSKGSVAGLTQKQDYRIPYNKDKPLFIAGNGGDGESLTYHSMLTGYQEGIGGGYDLTIADSVRGRRLSVRNTNYIWLERAANLDSSWFPNSRVRLETKDSLRMDTKLTGQAYKEWLKAGNGWCYELQVPPALNSSMFRIARQQLDLLFPAYSTTIETRTLRCIVLVRTSGEDKLKSAGGQYAVNVSPFACHLHNVSLQFLIQRLEVQFLQNSKLPIVNGTGYKDMVDLDFEAPTTDVDAINKALAKFDLAFVEKDYPARLMVIRDAPPAPRGK